jgi:hypothetical protein
MSLQPETWPHCFQKPRLKSALRAAQDLATDRHRLLRRLCVSVVNIHGAGPATFIASGGTHRVFTGFLDPEHGSVSQSQ